MGFSPEGMTTKLHEAVCIRKVITKDREPIYFNSTIRRYWEAETAFLESLKDKIEEELWDSTERA